MRTRRGDIVVRMWCTTVQVGLCEWVVDQKDEVMGWSTDGCGATVVKVVEQPSNAVGSAGSLHSYGGYSGCVGRHVILIGSEIAPHRPARFGLRA